MFTINMLSTVNTNVDPSRTIFQLGVYSGGEEINLAKETRLNRSPKYRYGRPMKLSSQQIYSTLLHFSLHSVHMPPPLLFIHRATPENPFPKDEQINYFDGVLFHFYCARERKYWRI